MPTSYLPYEPDQDLLLPHSLREWLPEDHLAHYISDTIETLDLGAFYERYESGGARNQPFHPAMMVKVLVYGYATGVFSSRKIARKLHEDVAFRLLAAGNFPKHRTISDFRALHLKELAELFVQVVKLAGECGLVRLGTIAVDGTKLKANASKHKAMSYQRMQAAEVQLQAQIQGLLAKAAQADRTEASEPELDLPAEIARREQRLAVIRAAQVRLQQRQREADAARGRKPDDDDTGAGGGPRKPGPAFQRPFGEPLPKAQDNFTDPDSRIMKSNAGFEQCYNAQTAVDAHAQIIVVAELTQSATDSGQLPGMIAALERNTGAAGALVLADAGYRNEAAFARLAESAPATELIVALGREGKRRIGIEAANLPYTAGMAVKLESPAGRSRYRRRKAIVEPANAWIKQVLGFRQFSLRGVEKVRCEFKLVCAALNLRRMARMGI
jgi:transposase